MMVASNFRFTARQALRGNWGISVLTLFVAGLLGASVTNVVTYTYNSSTSRTTFTDLSRFASDLFTGDFFYFMSYAAATVTAFAFVVMLYSLFRFIFGAAINLGVNQFTMRLVLRLEPHRVGTLFFRFHIFGRALLTRFLTSLFIFLWGLAFYLPATILIGISSGAFYIYGTGYYIVLLILGILLAIGGSIFLIAVQYRYAMAPYLLSQYPDMGALEAIRQSKAIMKGNKGRLFGLHFSFIGWYILCLFTFGVGYLWLSPYVKTAEAAFYLEITGQLPAWVKFPATVPGYPQAPPPGPPPAGPAQAPYTYGQPPVPPTAPPQAASPPQGAPMESPPSTMQQAPPLPPSSIYSPAPEDPEAPRP
ncbi:MAG: DUF975 family protein [Ruminococcaceae bacterium]|nr:DUF975 family protein [Oscillospiraceae bacterium]